MSRNIPNKDVDFDEKQKVIIAKVETKIVQWKIDESWFNTKVKPAAVAWDLAWAECRNNPSMLTHLMIFTKNEARRLYEPPLRILIEFLKYNPLVTPADLVEMGIWKPAAGEASKNPVPTTYPDYSIDSSVIRRLSINFRDQGAGKSRAKPHGVHGSEIRWAILNTPPTGIIGLVNSSFDTRSPFTLEFNEEERGKTVWFCLRWENTTGEKGPWSEIVSAIVP